jgi:DNA-binding response OmpR family regulator|tara:strand:- start:55 stop:441 length:387 start_codon:yes stop_codon:yes gene_type:complete
MARILVIDDDYLVRAMLTRSLTQAGHEVLEAANGDQGLSAFHADHPDIVITDIIMPDRDGIEIIMELQREAPGVQIIAISGGGVDARYSYLAFAEKLGAKRSFKKPIQPSALLAVIEEMMGGEKPIQH